MIRKPETFLEVLYELTPKNRERMIHLLEEIEKAMSAGASEKAIGEMIENHRQAFLNSLDNHGPEGGQKPALDTGKRW